MFIRNVTNQNSSSPLHCGRRPATFYGAAFLFAVSALLFGDTPGGEGFASPEAAAKALVSASKSKDVDALLKILGPAAHDIVVSGDPVADENGRQTFVERASQRMKVVSDPEQPGRKILEVGSDGWPLPIPLVKAGGKWRFDADQAKNDILLRRIGDNELTTITVCQGYVEAQFAYAEANPIKSQVPVYAQKFISSPDQRDGLYWKSDNPEDESPLGDAIAKAIAEGYKDKSEPYHGYYFKVLTAQGPHATGGAKSYLENGAMTHGFALIAWPSEYKVTGLMTFQVDRTGILYQKDLGEKTGEIAQGATEYDPDQTWTPVAGSGVP